MYYSRSHIAIIPLKILFFVLNTIFPPCLPLFKSFLKVHFSEHLWWRTCQCPALIGKVRGEKYSVAQSAENTDPPGTGLETPGKEKEQLSDRKKKIDLWKSREN